jgi:hypothetical protein
MGGKGWRDKEEMVGEEGGRRMRSYIRVNSVVDAMASKVIRCAAIRLVGFGLAFVDAGGEPRAEFGVVPVVVLVGTL